MIIYQRLPKNGEDGKNMEELQQFEGLDFLHFPDFVKCPHVSHFFNAMSVSDPREMTVFGSRVLGIALQLTDFQNM